MNFLWSALVILSIIVGLCTNNIEKTSTAIMESASSAVELSISLMGAMCFWTGMMEIAEKSGFIKGLAKIMRPFISFLFPEVKSKKAVEAIVMNMSANILGIGNAATPLGIKAMEELEKENLTHGVATNSMCMFVVINTASIQLIPTTLLALRNSYGSKNPFEIIPLVWISSVTALIFGVFTAKLCQKKY